LSLSKKYNVLPLPSVRIVPNWLFIVDDTAGEAADEEAVASERTELFGAADWAALLPHAAARSTSASNSAPRDLATNRVNIGSFLRSEFSRDLEPRRGCGSFQQ